MRKITTLLLVGLTLMFAAEGFAQRGIGTNLPDRSSVLHLESETRGLLIPRVELTSTTVATPIANPANSLLVYNTETAGGDVGEGEPGVRPGYYFWKRDNEASATPGQWIPLLNTAGNNIEIDDNGVVSVKPGGAAGHVLVTVDDGAGTLTSEWIPFGDFIKVLGNNGITVLPVTDPVTGITTFTVELGGALAKETIINTDGNKFEVQSGSDKFFVSGLNKIGVDADGNITGTGDVGAGTPADIFKNTFDVLIVGNDGLVQKVNVEDLLKNAIAVRNGLTYDDVNGFIELGGDLMRDTEINLVDKDFTIKTGVTTGDLKVEGLKETKTANKIMVVDDANSVRTVTRVISSEIPTTGLVSEIEGYSEFVHEVNITVSTIGADRNLVLPDATVAEGQVINVRLTITGESTNYLTIKDNGTDLTWGALPYQGWVLKSNGANWLIVSSN